MIRSIIEKLTKGDLRTSLMKKNIIVSASMRAAGLAISLFMVPMTLGYVDNAQFGIWMTISTILNWFVFLDVGLSNGMRNYMSAAVSNNDYNLARRYFTTTIVLLSVIMITVFVITCAVFPFINLASILSVSEVSDHELKLITITAIAFTLVSFVAKNVGFIYAAHQQYSVIDVLNFLGHLLGFIVIWILTLTTNGTLFKLVFALTSLPVIIYLVACIPTFRRFPLLLPTRSSFDYSLRHNIVGKGLGFFLIQITSCLVIFGSTNVFISHFCGPESVTVYNIAFKLFNILFVVYTIFISPLWNGYTDASVKGDWQWIAKTFRRSFLVWVLVTIGGLVMLAASGLFYSYWLHDKVTIPFSVSLCTFIYVSFLNLNNCATFLINGLNVIRVQIISSIITTVVYVLVIVLFGKSIGLHGIIICMSLSYAAMSIVHHYQCYLLINRKATGVWNK